MSSLENLSIAQLRELDKAAGSRHIFWHKTEGAVFSPTSSLLADLPESESDAHFPGRNPHRPGWLSHTRPYKAFMHTRPQLTGPLFTRLNFQFHEFPIVHASSGGYSLHPLYISAWWRLECALTDLAHRLVALSSTPYEYPMGPEEFGYCRTHRTEDIARRCAFRAKNAFLELAAAVSFGVALQPKVDESECPPWVTRLLKTSVHAQWLSDLRNSFICDFSPGSRVGAWVNPYETPWASLIPRFVASGIPLWILWGLHDKKVPLSPPILRTKYLPTIAEVRDAVARPAIPTTPSVTRRNQRPPALYVLTSSSELSPATDAGPPKPHPGAGQMQGETWQAFFQRMEHDRVTALATETPQEKQRRLDWQEYANVGLSKRAAVYEWSELSGFWLRTCVRASDAEDVWKDYKPSQRRFHDFLNQWDLCLPLDPPSTTAQQMLDDCGEGSFNDDYAPLPSPSGSVSNLDEPIAQPEKFDLHQPVLDDLEAQNAPNQPIDVAQPEKLDLCQAVLDDLEAQNATNQPIDEPPHLPEHVQEAARLPETSSLDWVLSIMENLRIRFGYTPSHPFVLHSSLISPDAQDVTQNMAMILRRFGDSKSEYKPSDLDILKDYHNVILSAQHPLQNLPHEWDISSSNPERVDVNPASLQIIRLPGDPPLYIFALPGDWTVQYYAICISSANTVLEVLRQDWGGILAIVRGLVTRGIPFHTVKALNIFPPPKLPVFSTASLGYRSLGYTPDQHDYRAYVQLRDSFLRETHGRAALLMGGIIWRLSRDVVPIKAATKGPSVDARLYGISIGGSHKLLIDDGLDQTALDIICGVYRTTDDHKQYQDLSWWPKANVWERCGLNVGYWSKDCERWYQGRLAEIEKGTARLYHSKQWIAYLRYDVSKMRKVHAATEKMSEVYLERFLRR